MELVYCLAVEVQVGYDGGMSLRFWRQPTTMTAILLLALYGLAWYFRGNGFAQQEVTRVVGVMIGLVMPHMLGYMVWKSKPRVDNLLISILLLLLLADPQTGMLSMVILGLLTAGVKTLLRIGQQPILNPAAGGLFLASFLGILTTWWGVSFAPRFSPLNISVAMAVTVPLGAYIIWKYKKLPTLVSVPISLLVMYFLLTGRVLQSVVEGTFAFFLLVMATEPKTTPVIDWQEWVFGLLLGSLLAFFFVNRVVSEPYLAALLVINLAFGVFRFVQLKLALRT